jgi:hypothetical protein
MVLETKPVRMGASLANAVAIKFSGIQKLRRCHVALKPIHASIQSAPNMPASKPANNNRNEFAGRPSAAASI